MKLTDLQKYKLNLAHALAAEVLRDMKGKVLKGAELEQMKDLETSVQALETVRLKLK